MCAGEGTNLSANRGVAAERPSRRSYLVPDEPTSALDVGNQLCVLDRIHELVARGNECHHEAEPAYEVQVRLAQALRAKLREGRSLAPLGQSSLAVTNRAMIASTWGYPSTWG